MATRGTTNLAEGWVNEQSVVFASWHWVDKDVPNLESRLAPGGVLAGVVWNQIVMSLRGCRA